jgi:hypothetical protein
LRTCHQVLADAARDPTESTTVTVDVKGQATWVDNGASQRTKTEEDPPLSEEEEARINRDVEHGEPTLFAKDSIDEPASPLGDRHNKRRILT